MTLPLTLGVRLALALAVGSTAVAGWGYVRQALILRTPLPGAEPVEDACTLWFVGSSSIQKWTSLAADMAPWSVRNRGVNGALLDEIGHRFGNDPPTRAPAAVVFYGGENDLAAGRSPDEAAGAMLALVAAQQRRMPGVPAFVIALKPSPMRWSMRPAQLAANQRLAAGLARYPRVTYIATGRQLLVGGAPGPFYQEDGIHLDAAGYRRWGGSIRHAIDAAMPAALGRLCLSGRGTSA